MIALLFALAFSTPDAPDLPPVAARTEPVAAPTHVKPEWREIPQASSMMRVYPPEALRAHKSGRAVIACQLTAAGQAENCVVLSESPADFGFGEAALKLAPILKFTTTDKDGKSIVGGTFRIPLAWSAPD